MLNIDNGYTVKLLSDLVDISSVFPSEKEIILFLERELTQIGLPVERVPISESRWNILARIGNGSPVLCLNAHADTVPPNGDSTTKAQIKDENLHGLGSADDKGSIAAMVSAVKTISESGAKLNGTLDLLISVDEEGDAKGVRTAIERGYRCDMALTGEPTSLGIVAAHCGLVFLDIVTHGKSTHGSIPMEGINAIEMIYELVSGLKAAVTDFPAHPLVGQPTLNLGIMKGGDRPNRVPDRCEASIDIRLVPPMTTAQVLERIEGCFAKWKDRAEYKITKQGGSLDTSHDSPIVKALSAAIGQVCGKVPPMVGWRGWTEAEPFQSRLGIDAVVFGPGALVRAHSADEYVELDQLNHAAQIYAETALKLLS